MNWENYLQTELRIDRENHFERHFVKLSEGMINLGSNDYLGLSNHPDVIEAASQSIASHGMGNRAARLLAGHTELHEEMDAQIARLKMTEAALSFPSGYTTSIGVIPAIAQKQATIIIDEKAHACLWDGARLSGARVRMVSHNDMDHLNEILELERTQSQTHPILIIVESLYSMEGHRCPLKELIELKQRWNAWLLVDEAHASGVFGNKGQGLIESQEQSDQVEVQLGTLGKAIGTQGGFVAGSQPLISLIRQRARSFLFATAAPPAIAAASIASLKIIQSSEGAARRKHLFRLLGHLANNKIFPLDVVSPIIPISIGNEERAAQIAGSLWAKKIYLPAIRFPTVPRGAARLRLSVGAHHNERDLDRVLMLLKELIAI
ncbi:MAG: pyridoxal phosphate-dependent aminotransferase family protein [Verrucomicrobiota bacterium]